MSTTKTTSRHFRLSSLGRKIPDSSNDTESLTLDLKCVAIVIDPLRSFAKQVPDIMCFRCYPPEYTHPDQSECPDGKIVPDEILRTTRWGKLHNRYYALKVEFFISALGKRFLDILSMNHLWIRVLSSAAIMEPENRAQTIDRIANLADRLDVVDIQSSSRSRGRMGLGTDMGSGSAQGATSKSEGPLEQSSIAAADIALELCEGHIKQIVKNSLFNPSRQP